MNTEKRILASRANGARSRGPITPAGKARSRSAIRSHRLAAANVLSNESSTAFFTLLGHHYNCLVPTNDLECAMIEEMVSAYWRMRRGWAIENSLLESATADQPDGPELLRISQANGELSSNQQVIALRREETRLHRVYQRALHNLFLVRKLESNAGAHNSPVSNIPTEIPDPTEPTEPN
ncbi:MAG: hypothetical protein ABI806_27875 [Candidatus Solibacter sp.]